MLIPKAMWAASAAVRSWPEFRPAFTWQTTSPTASSGPLDASENGQLLNVDSAEEPHSVHSFRHNRGLLRICLDRRRLLFAELGV